jgi:phosphoribosylformylglycinamidine synthase subunit PurL
VCEVPGRALTDEAPRYVRDGHPPRDLVDRWAANLQPLAARQPSVPDLLDLLASPNLRSRRPVWQQFDHMNGASTLVGPGAGNAALLRVKGTRRALAFSLDGPGAAADLDPRLAAASAVLEAALNVAVCGARPIGLTNCLNFGSPETPEGYWQLSEAVSGLSDACAALGIPIVSGNVSLYNETPDGPIPPTPVVGMVGLLEDRATAVPMRWQDGDELWLLGDASFDVGSLAGSQIARRSGARDGRPRLDPGAPARLIELLPRLADSRLLRGARDVSLGGVWVALARMAIASGSGARVSVPPGTLLTAALFGERTGRAIVAIRAAEVAAVCRAAEAGGVEMLRLGTAGGEMLQITAADRALSVSLDQLRDAYGTPFRPAPRSVAVSEAR